MAAIANPALKAESRLREHELFLAADVGGTHVRVGLVQATASTTRPVTVLDYQTYACARFAGLAEILEDFLGGRPAHPIRCGVIASAGLPLQDGTVISANLPWPLSPRAIQARLGFADLRLVNDFEAVAHAAPHVEASQVLQLAGPTQGADGPRLILGPGTGLGAAVWIPAHPRPIVLATEAGHASLAAGNALELALLGRMLGDRSHVPVEHALSGPGLLNLHSALCALHGVPVRYTTPGDITTAALAGDDEHAHDTLQVFCGLLGSVVGDMALFYGVQGGIYLAGGILPQLGGFLIESGFVARFLNKGPLRQALEHIPVKLVEHGQLGVLGAARWYLDQPDHR
ncbi:glucokinase family protein [Pseudoxanthomonas sp.]|uniref:glucokinase family protein n=1 Tax=Pseudoxanthomonas sp. TaxID=1871049 RepID=UPI003F82051C